MSEAQDVLAAQQAAADAVTKQSKMLDKIFSEKQMLERSHSSICEDLASRLNRVGLAHRAVDAQLAAANARIAHLEALLDEQRRGTPIIVDPADPAISLALNAHKRIDNLEQKLEDKK